MLISEEKVLADLNKSSDVVKDDVVKKDLYNAKIKNFEDKIPDITNLATNATLNAKTNKGKNEIPSITNLGTFNKLTSENFTARLAQVNLKNKICMANFVKRADLNKNELNELSEKLKQYQQLDQQKIW